jgi:hypothetical protein
MDGNRKDRHRNSARRMKNIRRHPVRGYIKIIILDKKDCFSEKKVAWNFPKWGQGGDKMTGNEKGSTTFKQ